MTGVQTCALPISGFIPGIMGLNRFTYFDPEKFAELIIKECAELVEEGVMIRETYKDIYKNFSTADIIRDHFGIKE